MELSFFQHLAKNILANCRLKAHGWPISIYRYFDKEWHQNSTVINDKSKLPLLEKAREQKNYIKIGLLVHIYIKSIDAVLEAAIPKGTKALTIQHFEGELLEVIQNAEFQFNAHHDQLTRLLNRTGFEDEIKKLLPSVSQPSVADDTNTLSSQSFVGLITFDIDHFKQINDSYHHQYGDVVLKAFSWRIAEHVKQIMDQEKVECVLARVGGEEFDLFIVRLKEKNAIQEIAESFRHCVIKEELPSDSQWKSISKDLKLASTKLKLPPKSERGVKASIGFSVMQFSGKEEPLDTYAKLKSQAEAALFRAKANGRDCVINYEDIRRVHGRVLDSHLETNMVSIDIGSDVGVKNGDVFAVRLPNFSGGVPLFHEDGRSKKKIGTYPKLSSGRIAVIDVQEGVSFCQIIEKPIATTFPKDSRLEYIPMGISRPLLQSCLHTPSGAILSSDDFLNELSKVVSTQNWRSIFVFSIMEHNKNDLPNRDSAITRTTDRSSLANLIQASFPSGATIGFIRNNLLAVYYQKAPKNNISDVEMIERVIKSSNFENLITCGYVVRLEKSNKTTTTDWSNLSAQDLLYAGRIANYYVTTKLTNNLSKETSDQHEKFSSSTANLALHALRKAQLYEDVIVDYSKLCRLGVDTSAIHNQLALSIIDQRNFEKMPMAELALQRVLDINHDDKIILWNMGIVKTYLGKYSDGYTNLSKNNLTNDETLYWLYYLAYFKCIYELEKNGTPPDAERVDLLPNLIKLGNKSKPTTKIELQWLTELKTYARKLKTQN